MNHETKKAHKKTDFNEMYFDPNTQENPTDHKTHPLVLQINQGELHEGACTDTTLIQSE